MRRHDADAADPADHASGLGAIRWLVCLLLAPFTLAADKPTARIGKPDAVAVLPLASPVLGAPTLRALNDVLVVTMDQLSDYDIISPSDVDSILGAEALKDALGCDDVRCTADIAGALGSRYVLSGSITKLGDQLLVTLSLMDAQHVRAESRAQSKMHDDENLYEQAVVQAVRDLLGLAGASAAPPTTQPGDDALVSKLRAGIAAADVAGNALPPERQTERLLLLDRALAEPQIHVIPFVRARLADNLDGDRLEDLLAFLIAHDPKTPVLLAAVTPIVVSIAWPKGNADERVSTRFLDSVEARATSLGLETTRKREAPQGGWRLVQELTAVDQGTMMGTAMHSYAVGGAFRLVSAQGVVKDGFDNRGTAVHVSPEAAYANAAERVASAAVARVVRQVLLDATLIKP
jgi:hypothetical protein